MMMAASVTAGLCPRPRPELRPGVNVLKLFSFVADDEA
jgi:hypothetical protein